ncbi:hypothetical protein CKM354_000935200 [Cercospora kikuchii]|uniref:Uncharacterized protein n=1 Tax=Cercospora kikuchii TaxID=84275 RepID=A0A9P3FJ41_9PEZI|nr:uncharacterized protein CKM354_000935200 [Cercospora kikuchii]GIZ46217.1 hypothetical protein CKM354_000935200 [Cercospora kikuchii]
MTNKPSWAQRKSERARTGARPGMIPRPAAKDPKLVEAKMKRRAEYIEREAKRQQQEAEDAVEYDNDGGDDTAAEEENAVHTQNAASHIAKDRWRRAVKHVIWCRTKRAIDTYLDIQHVKSRLALRTNWTQETLDALERVYNVDRAQANELFSARWDAMILHQNGRSPGNEREKNLIDALALKYNEYEIPLSFMEIISNMISRYGPLSAKDIAHRASQEEVPKMKQYHQLPHRVKVAALFAYGIPTRRQVFSFAQHVLPPVLAIELEQNVELFLSTSPFFAKVGGNRYSVAPGFLSLETDMIKLLKAAPTRTTCKGNDPTIDFELVWISGRYTKKIPDASKTRKDRTEASGRDLWKAWKDGFDHPTFDGAWSEAPIPDTIESAAQCAQQAFATSDHVYTIAFLDGMKSDQPFWKDAARPGAPSVTGNILALMDELNQRATARGARAAVNAIIKGFDGNCLHPSTYHYLSQRFPMLDFYETCTAMPGKQGSALEHYYFERNCGVNWFLWDTKRPSVHDITRAIMMQESKLACKQEAFAYHRVTGDFFSSWNSTMLSIYGCGRNGVVVLNTPTLDTA